MKLEIGEKPIVIGKRVPIGAAISSVALVFSNLFPENSGAILASSIALTFIAQIIIANFLGVTK